MDLQTYFVSADYAPYYFSCFAGRVCIHTFLFANSSYHHHNIIVAGLAYTNAHFGSGTGSIVLDDVQCVSSDNQLLECSSRPIFSHNCAHSDDAGVGCEGNAELYCIADISIPNT